MADGLNDLFDHGFSFSIYMVWREKDGFWKVLCVFIFFLFQGLWRYKFWLLQRSESDSKLRLRCSNQRKWCKVLFEKKKKQRRCLSHIQMGKRRGYGSDGLDKFTAIRSIIQTRVGAKLPDEIPVIPVFSPFPHRHAHSFGLFDYLDEVVDRSVQLRESVFAEMFDQFFGFTLYDFGALKSSNQQVTIPAFADRALVFSDSKRLALFESSASSAVIENVPASSRFSVLVENIGRVNFWHEMPDERKGRFFFPFLLFAKFTPRKD